MARTHKLASNSNAYACDLLTGILKLVDAWRWQYTRDGKVIETATLAAHGDDDDIENAVNTLNYLGKLANDWKKDKQNTESVWYYLYGDDEVGKRALVEKVECVSISNGLHSPLLGTGAAFYQLTITRSAIWEDAIAQTFAATVCSALGGHIDLPAIDGDLDARVEQLSIRANKDGALLSSAMTRVWFGMKPEYNGTTYFNGKHECEDFTINPSCSPLPTVELDATASGLYGGQKVQWQTSATWQWIIYRHLNGLINGSHVASYRGRYQVLLRCKVSSAQDIRLQLRWGYGGADVSLGDRYINHTNWQLVEMGEITIPAGTWRAAAAENGLSRNAGMFYLYGQHMNSPVTLSLDCIILIPTMAHGYANGTEIGYKATDWDHGGHFYQFEDGERIALNYELNGTDLASIYGGVQYDGETFYYLRDGGPLVFAGQRNGIQEKNDTVKIELSYRRRYVNHAEPIP